MSTVVGRAKLDHPSLAAAGGSALHAAIETIYTNVSDDLSGRFATFSGIANSTTNTYEHNFGVPFSELQILLYTGSHPSLVKVDSITEAGYSIVANGSFLETKIDITTPASGGPHTFAVFIVHAGPGIFDIDAFKVLSVSTPNAVIKGGYQLFDNGKELATYDGSGSASTDFGKDLTVSLTTIFGSAPANATAYYLYIDLNSLSASVTQTDTGRVVYAVQQANFALSTTKPELQTLTRYAPVAVIKSATTGTAWSGSGSSFKTLSHSIGQVTSPVTATPTVLGVVDSYYPTNTVSSTTDADKTVTTTDGFRGFVMASFTANRTLTLPAASANIGRLVHVIHDNAGSQQLSVVTGGGDSIIKPTNAILELYGYGSTLTFLGVTSTQWALIGPAFSITLTLDNNFSAGTVRLQKWGNTVMAYIRDVTFASGSNPLSSSSLIPAGWRPSVSYSNICEMAASYVLEMTVSSGGQIGFEIRDWNGSGTNRTSITAGSLSGMWRF